MKTVTVDRVVTVTVTSTVFAGKPVPVRKGGPFTGLLFVLMVIVVLAALAVASFVALHVYQVVSGHVKEKIEKQNRFTFSDKGIGVKVRTRTDEEKSASAQR
jgi:hypothetical protein